MLAFDINKDPVMERVLVAFTNRVSRDGLGSLDVAQSRKIWSVR